jgi:large subunit ribosomal protein L29
MKATEIRGMRTDELGKKLDELEGQLFALRTQAVTEKVENTQLIKNTRRDIARVKTIMKEKQIVEKGE